MTTGETGLMLELTAERRAPLEHLVAAWLDQREASGRDERGADAGALEGEARQSHGAERRIEVREVEVIRTGRPLLFDVLADVDGRSAHALLGVRSEPTRGEVAALARADGDMADGDVAERDVADAELARGDPKNGVRPPRHARGSDATAEGTPSAVATGDQADRASVIESLPGQASTAGGSPASPGETEDGGLGLIQDEQGVAVVIDALRDPELAHLALEAVTGQPSDGEAVTIVSDTDDETVLDFAGRSTFTVFPWVVDGPHRGVEMLLALDDAGFNHLAAPVAVWRRGGHDLGVVQEQLAGQAAGWALALTSLRDLYGSGGRPEDAGGDFGPEAQALGTMTARMHLALERAFGQIVIDAVDWVEEMRAGVSATNAALLEGVEVTTAMQGVRASGLRASALRTHGDFHLGRTARTDAGWVVADWSPGGCPPGSATPVFRSPLADVADMLWSIYHVSTVATSERDPTGRGGTTRLSRTWADRNRSAFLMAYLAAPGISAIVPSDRTLVRHLVTVFELERATSQVA